MKLMKVQELRNLLGTSERAHLEKAFVECYKQLRKGQKEEIDPILTTILEGKEMNPKAKGSPVDFAQLEQQINEFIRNANALNYFIPNRTIPKSQRPKWRFLVKNYIKELAKIPADSENHEKSVKLLSDLYGLICEACNVYIFSTEDPFRSIGMETAGSLRAACRKSICQRIFAGKHFPNAPLRDRQRIEQGVPDDPAGIDIARPSKNKRRKIYRHRRGKKAGGRPNLQAAFVGQIQQPEIRINRNHQRTLQYDFPNYGRPRRARRWHKIFFQTRYGTE